MRLPRPRFTVRWLLAYVLIAAGFFQVDRMLWLTVGHRRRYQFYEGIVIQEGKAAPVSLRPSARARWARDLAAKYRRAARYPWLSVEPDPPEPG